MNNSKKIFIGLVLCGISLPTLFYAFTSWEAFYNSIRYDEHWWGSDAGTVTDEGEFRVYMMMITMIIFAVLGTALLVSAYRDIKRNKQFREESKI